MIRDQMWVRGRPAWAHSPLYEAIARIPLLVYIPGQPGPVGRATRPGAGGNY